MRVNSLHPTSSSLANLNRFYRQKLIKHGIFQNEHEIRVKTTTLDSLKFEALERPILMKLDIEGREIEALKGGRTLLSHTEMLIAELSVAERFEGAPSCGEFLAFMEACGFALFDVVDLAQLAPTVPW